MRKAILAGMLVMGIASPVLKADTLKELSLITIDKHDRLAIAEGVKGMNGVVDYFIDENRNRVNVMYDPSILLPYEVKEMLARIKVPAKLKTDNEYVGITEAVFTMDTIDNLTDKNVRAMLANNIGIVDIFLNVDSGTISVLYLNNVQNPENLSLALAMNGIGNNYATADRDRKHQPKSAKKNVGGI